MPNWIKGLLPFNIGQCAEQKAREFLETQGLTYVTSNYRCRSGEIDIIMGQQAELVFVEVKYRKDSRFGQPAEFFTQSKRKKFESAIYHYFQQQGLNPSSSQFRIDLVAICGDQVQWIKHV